MGISIDPSYLEFVATRVNDDEKPFLIAKDSDSLVEAAKNDGDHFYIRFKKDELYNLVCENAIKIDDDVKKFYYGEFPTGKLDVNTNKMLLQAYSDGRLISTGRVYFINWQRCQEFEFKGKRYVKIKNEFVRVDPIEWIIFTKTHRVISRRPLRKQAYDAYAVGFNLTQFIDGFDFIQKPNNRDVNGNVNIYNIMLDISDSVLYSYYGMNDRGFYCREGVNRFYDEFWVPEGVTNVCLSQDDYKKISKLHLARSVKTSSYVKRVSLSTLEIYDDATDLNVLFDVDNKITVHYRNYETLEKFIKKFKEHVRFPNLFQRFTRGIPFLLRGVYLNPIEKAKIRLLLGYNAKFIVEERYDRAMKRDLSESTIERDNVFTQRETINDLKEKINEFLRKFPRKYSEYISKLDEESKKYEIDLENIFNRFEDLGVSAQREQIAAAELIHKEYVSYLESLLGVLKTDAEYRKMINLVDLCISILNSQNIDVDSELLKKFKEFMETVNTLSSDNRKSLLDEFEKELTADKTLIQEKLAGDSNVSFNYSTFDEFKKKIAQRLDDFFRKAKSIIEGKADIDLGAFDNSNSEYLAFQISSMNSVCSSIDKAVCNNPQYSTCKDIKRQICELYINDKTTNNIDAYVNKLIDILSQLPSSKNVRKQFFQLKNANDMENKNLNLFTNDKVKNFNIKKLNYTLLALNYIENYINGFEELRIVAR